jgi:hypothetical protein
LLRRVENGEETTNQTPRGWINYFVKAFAMSRVS